MINFEIPNTDKAYGLLEFATHVLDYSPVLETRSQMRNMSKVIDEVEKAVKSGSTSVSMENDLGELFKLAVESTPVPKLYMVINGKPGDAVPRSFFKQLYEAVENGKVCD